MNRKQFIILSVLVVFIGAAGLLIRQRSNDSWQRSGTSFGQKLLPDLAVNDITQITIRSGTNTLNLARRDNLWRVRERGNYPANFSAISSLLLKFADLKITQSQEVGVSQLGRFELLPPGSGANSGTLVEFKAEGGKTLDSVLLGKKHLKKPTGNSQFGGLGDEGWPDGRYVMVGTGAKTLAVISDALDSVQARPEQWLNKDFLHIEKPCAISVQYVEAKNSWKLTRASETNDWQLANIGVGEKPDPSKLSSVTSPFSSPGFTDVSVSAPETSGLTNLTVLTVETFDGFVYTVRMAPKQGDDYPVTFSITAKLPSERAVAKDEKPEDKARLDKEFADRHKQLAEKLAGEKQFENWVYAVPAYAIDPILKPRSQLLAEEKVESSPQPAK